MLRCCAEGLGRLLLVTFTFLSMISFIYFCWTISQLHSQIDDAVQNCEDLKDSYSSYSWDDDLASCEDPYKFDIFVMDFFIALIESWFLGVFKEYAKFWWKVRNARTNVGASNL